LRQHDINPIRESSPLGNYYQILWHALQFVSCSCDVGVDWKLVHDDFPHINRYSRRTWNWHLVWYSEKKAFHGATHCSEREGQCNAECLSKWVVVPSCSADASSHMYDDKSRLISKHLSNQERSCSEVRHSLMTQYLKQCEWKKSRVTERNHASLGWESRITGMEWRVTGNGICNEASFRPTSEQFKSAYRTVTRHWWKPHRFQLEVLQCSMERVYVLL
jgi:hypothetical protein